MFTVLQLWRTENREPRPFRTLNVLVYLISTLHHQRLCTWRHKLTDPLTGWCFCGGLGTKSSTSATCRQRPGKPSEGREPSKTALQVLSCGCEFTLVTSVCAGVEVPNQFGVQIKPQPHNKTIRQVIICLYLTSQRHQSATSGFSSSGFSRVLLHWGPVCLVWITRETRRPVSQSVFSLMRHRVPPSQQMCFPH